MLAPMLTRRFLAVLAALCALALPAAAQPRPVTVFAAASLTDVLGAIGADYTRRTGTPVRFSFASSAVAARQIEAGAQADVFVSADVDWMDHLQRRGRIQPASRRDLLGNRLALVARKGDKRAVKIAPNFPLAAALGEGRLAIADPDSVPAGRYARSALQALKVWPAVQGRLAQAENVRVALAYVARGEAPLGIVYQTDALAEPGVRIVDLFPERSHPPIVYPAALTRSAGPEAAAFLAHLRSPAARDAFRRAGFRTL